MCLSHLSAASLYNSQNYSLAIPAVQQRSAQNSGPGAQQGLCNSKQYSPCSTPTSCSSFNVFFSYSSDATRRLPFHSYLSLTLSCRAPLVPPALSPSSIRHVPNHTPQVDLERSTHLATPHLTKHSPGLLDLPTAKLIRRTRIMQLQLRRLLHLSLQHHLSIPNALVPTRHHLLGP